LRRSAKRRNWAVCPRHRLVLHHRPVGHCETRRAEIGNDGSRRAEILVTDLFGDVRSSATLSNARPQG
jgi:hypothetical protein